MPVNEEQLWKLLKEKKYNDAINFINEHTSDLELNAINLIGDSFLMAALRGGLKHQDPHFLPFFNTLLQSNKFTLGNHINQKSKQNAFDLALDTANPQLIAIFLEYSHKVNVIDSRDKLQYVRAKTKIEDNCRIINDPNLSEFAQQQISGLTQILPMLRDAAILHAIDKGDTGLFQALTAAGAEPWDALSDGRYPTEVAKESGKMNIVRWFESNARSDLEGLIRTHSIFATCRQQMDQAIIAHATALADITERTLNRFVLQPA